jgi:hypothetical protein
VAALAKWAWRPGDTHQADKDALRLSERTGQESGSITITQPHHKLVAGIPACLWLDHSQAAPSRRGLLTQDRIWEALGVQMDAIVCVLGVGLAGLQVRLLPVLVEEHAPVEPQPQVVARTRLQWEDQT